MASKTPKKKKTAPKGSGRPGSQRLVAHSATTVAVDKPIGVGDWIKAARPATLGLAVAPVITGWGISMFNLTILADPRAILLVQGPAVLALLVAIFLQVGVNFANDYSDGIRGTDAHRVGPRRLTASGRVDPKRVRNLAFVFFGLAAVAGLGIGHGVFQSGKLAVKGFLAWGMHRGYHGLAIPMWERKLRVFTGWAWNWIVKRDLVSIMAVKTPRLAFETYASRPAAAPAAAKAPAAKKAAAPKKAAAKPAAEKKPAAKKPAAKTAGKALPKKK